MKTPMQTRTKLTALAVMVVAAAATTITVAGAQTGSLEIPIDTVVFADEGSTTVLATVDVPADLQGATCTVTSEAENNSSVHPGNDLVVRSGNDTEEMIDVEGAPGKITPASEQLTLGSTITVSLVMGSDEVFSGGGVVTLDCTAPEPTTTTTTTEAVAVSPSSIAPTPTTAAPTVAPTTSTVATQVLPGVQVAAPAQATPGSPSFTG